MRKWFYQTELSCLTKHSTIVCILGNLCLPQKRVGPKLLVDRNDVVLLLFSNRKRTKKDSVGYARSASPRRMSVPR